MDAATGIDATIARVADWIGRCGLSSAEIARRADVDHKTVRLARLPGWNPTADVLRRFEQLIPEDWRLPSQKRKDTAVAAPRGAARRAGFPAPAGRSA
jgi:hypothetical protein